MMKKNTQIGGKGTMRHTKKKKFIRTEDRQKFSIEKIVTNINLKISYLGKDKKKELTNIIDKDIEKLVSLVKKEDVSKTTLTLIKNEKKDFFYKRFFYIENEIIILLREKLYETIVEYFQGTTRQLCFDLLKIIDNLLQSSKKIKADDIDKNKIEKNEEEPYNEELFTESLLHFGITKKRVHFTEIKNIYDNCNPKSISDDIHYQRLKSQYSNYLSL